MSRHNGNTIIRWLIFLGDIALLNGILLFFIKFFPELIPPVLDVKTRMFAFICNVAMVVAQYFLPTVVYRRQLHMSSVLLRVFQMVLVQTIIAFVLIRILYNNGGMFRFMLYYAPTLFCVLMAARCIERIALKWYRQSGGNTRAFILIGNDPANMLVYKELTEDRSTGYYPKGYYSNSFIEDGPKELKKLGSLADLDDAMAREDKNLIHIEEFFCCLSHDDAEFIKRIMRFCDKHVIRFFYVPRMLGNYKLNLKVERFGNLDLYTNHQEPLTDPVNRAIKRMFDITVSLLTCIVMLPFIPIIALIIKVQSPGPIFFKQDRTGLNGETFRCYKFRSMHINNDSDMQQATLDDPRKFPFGNFMRKCNIDEFPQFFNVLKGDMSIVGPRPHMLYHTEVYSDLIDKYMVRHFSKPGITGWAQVTGFRGETKELWQMEERIRRDIWYIENWSFLLDLRIIGMTFFSLFKPDKKAY